MAGANVRPERLRGIPDRLGLATRQDQAGAPAQRQSTPAAGLHEVQLERRQRRVVVHECGNCHRDPHH